MSFGIIVRNEMGDMLIHSDYEMFHLHSQQDFSTSSIYMTQTLSFSGLNNQPIVLGSTIDGQGASLACRVWKNSALWDRIDVEIVSGNLSKTIRVWVFARGEGGEGQPYGIRVYRPNGSLSFDSSRKMLRHHASFSGTVTHGYENTHDFSELPYAPPININARYVSIWSDYIPNTDPPLGYEMFQSLRWRLIKNANNQYFRVGISLMSTSTGSIIPHFMGGVINTIEYSGFIFKYQ